MNGNGWELRAPALASVGQRLSFVDEIKGLAMLLVIIYHCSGPLAYSNWLHGEAGVDVFLIISGVVLSINCAGQTTGAFLRRRFFRLFPTYWAVLFLCIALYAWYGRHFSWWNISTHVLGVHGFSTEEHFTGISYSFWFVSIIVLLYLLFLVLRRRLHDFSLVVSVGLIASVVGFTIYQQTGNIAGLIHLGVRLPDIFVGFLLGQLVAGRPLIIKPTLLLSVTLLGYALLVFNRLADFPIYPVAALAWIAAYAGLSRACSGIGIWRGPSALFAFVGVYSYEIYLLHQPVILDFGPWAMRSWFNIATPLPWQKWAGVTTGLACVVLVSIPLHRLGNWIFRKKPTAGATAREPALRLETESRALPRESPPGLRTAATEADLPCAPLSASIKEPRELQRLYERRFGDRIAYRQRLWRTLNAHFFQRFVRPEDTVLDLGCGYGEFINSIRCHRKLAMDLNPQARVHLNADVELFAQDCSRPWPIGDGALDVVFSSNLFEHLPDKLALKNTLLETVRCLRPGGQLIALGPNIRYVHGAYWNFWDHFLCLTEMSLGEALENNGFRVTRSDPRFLPYTTIHAPDYPNALIRLYLALPFVWPVFGRQYLVVAERL